MALNEPIIEIDDIQGNSLADFSKDFQNLLFFKLPSLILQKSG
ncbi:hypothetical protein [Bacillus wiedmannii]|nr:hypothetical protein [Bacillus wiedmannii]MED3615466.1 hypothetical protein [Bacillus wiedmannii]